jgi:acyl carrier protein
MRRIEFYLMLDEIIDEEPGTIQGDEALSGLGGWDSLAVMTFIAAIDENFNVILEPRELADCQTIADLLNLVKNHIED